LGGGAKIKGVVIYGKEDFRYQEVEIPKIGREEVLVKVARYGICAADPKIFHGKAYFSQVAYDHAPIVAGHEFIGEVVELGPGAAEKFNLKVGDKAIAEQIVPCWECYFCKRGIYNMCDVHEVFGVSGPDGGWAEYIKYPAKSIVWKVPQDLSYEKAILIEPFACAIHGVQRANVQLGEVAVIAGAGAIGLLMLEVLKLKHPQKIVVMEPDDHRREIAQELGADLVINPLEEDPVEKVKELTGGLGCDVVLEASGSPQAVEAAIEMLRRRGRLMEFAVFAKKTCIDFSIISDVKELEIIGGHLGAYTYPLAIKYLNEGLVHTEKIATHNFPLPEWRKAIETSESKKNDAIKVTMTP